MLYQDPDSTPQEAAVAAKFILVDKKVTAKADKVEMQIWANNMHLHLSISFLYNQHRNKLKEKASSTR